ncbi:MAG TPA: IPT/TIG domain-containing protein, partial [Thermoanaerobaculia bacterium]|nr:IPT/TIG domain-containing protein [Thermoanaerobaculia bacterium]
GTPPGSAPTATYNISVAVSPSQVPAGSTDPVQVTVEVRRRDTNQPPPNGTTIVLSAGAGNFGAPDGGNSVVVQLVNGQAVVSFFPPAIQGTVVIQARLESSIGQATLQIAQPATFFVASVSPSTGNPAGGEEVEIQGGGFDPPVRVTFGGVPAQVLSVSASRIRVVTPPAPSPVGVGETLPVTVAVTINLNEEGQATDSLNNAFLYARGGGVAQPQVFSVTPASGPNEGGTRVTINGEGFQAPVQVFFGSGSSAANFTGIEASVQSVTANQIVVLTPAATGFGQDNQNQTVDILVKNLDTGFATVAPLAFQYGTKVIITAAGPGSGPYTGGTLVTIHGQGFDEPVAVSLGGVGQPVISVTGTQIVFRTVGINVSSCPANGQVTVTGISVTNIESGDGANAPNLGFTFLVPTPLITSVSPTSGPQGGGTAVTLSGQGFEAPVRVRFIKGGESFTATVTGTSSTSVGATTPAVPNSVLDTASCDDNADSHQGERYLRTAFDVEVENLGTGCTDRLEGAFTYVPADQTCRNDVGPPPPDDEEDEEEGG